MDAVFGILFVMLLLLMAFCAGSALRSDDAAKDCKRFGAVSIQGVVYECKVRP